MEAKAVWIEGNRLELETKGQAFVADACHEEKGERCPPSPIDYFNASFAGCVAYFIAKALRNRGVEPVGLRVLLEADYAEAPHRVGAYRLEVELPAGLSNEMIGAARRAAEACTVHNTLEHPPAMSFHYRIPGTKGTPEGKAALEEQHFFSQKD
jgi:uncharacterized OsmC-like protein